MNRYQQARQIAHLASEFATVNGTPVSGGGEALFQQVWISGGVATEDADLPDEVGVAMPFAILRPGDAITDGEHKHRKRCRWSLLYGQSVFADATGEAATIGFIRDTDSIEGYGSLEIEERLEALFADTGITQDGLEIAVVGARAIGPRRSPRFGYVMLQTLELESFAGIKRRYPSQCDFSGAAGAGTVTLTWKLAPGWARMWSQNRQVLRRAVGGTPPASITDGADVSIGVLDTSRVDSPGAGTFSYSLFAVYDEVRADTLFDDHVSLAQSLTVSL